MKFSGLKYILLLATSTLYSQTSDTLHLISEVQIDAYKKPVKFMASTKAVSVAAENFSNQNNPDRLLESLNLLPGTKMEERSPGSYRLSLRGSTLRSPFGVRNVKIYLDDFILTDATGNTYLNLIDPELIQKSEIYKGPESGDFGAVTGGTVLLKTSDNESVRGTLKTGSYSLFKQNLHYSKNLEQHFLQLYQSFSTSESYRQQAALNRKIFYFKDKWNYRDDAQLNTILLYTDLHYETPGGLTLVQMQADRKQARPATSTLPGSEEQRAGIYNKTILAGISHQTILHKNISHFALAQGSYTDFRNPFITNYEKRFETNFALRTHLNFEKYSENWFLQTRIGYEGAISQGLVKNYDNNNGAADAPQHFDKIVSQSGFVFLSQKADYRQKLFVEASASLNSVNYDWKRLYPASQGGSKSYKNDFLPNLGITYLVNDQLSLRGKIGKGNSAPTTEELRSSTQQINFNLEPEYGWNKEIGIRKQFGNFLYLEGSYFDFRLQNAIVRRQNENGQEYFVNAGGTKQKGLEVTAETKNISINSSIINTVKLWFSGSFYRFRFDRYQKDQQDFSGNQLTGVPAASVQSLVSLKFFKALAVDISNFYTSKIYLNDANTAQSQPNLVGNLSIRYPFQFKNLDLNLNLQVQNIYNTDYVAGYDLNAFGGRYYNPAPARHFIIGASLLWK